VRIKPRAGPHRASPPRQLGTPLGAPHRASPPRRRLRATLVGAIPRAPTPGWPTPRQPTASAHRVEGFAQSTASKASRNPCRGDPQSAHTRTAHTAPAHRVSPPRQPTACSAISCTERCNLVVNRVEARGTKRLCPDNTTRLSRAEGTHSWYHAPAITLL
jgi:hypothetical protein